MTIASPIRSISTAISYLSNVVEPIKTDVEIKEKKSKKWGGSTY